MNRLIAHRAVADSERDGSLQTALWKCWIIGLPAILSGREASKRHSSVSPDPRAHSHCYGFSRTVAVPTGETALTDISVTPVLELHHMHRQITSRHYTE
jgi:hypothetical protein